MSEKIIRIPVRKGFSNGEKLLFAKNFGQDLNYHAETQLSVSEQFAEKLAKSFKSKIDFYN